MQIPCQSIFCWIWLTMVRLNPEHCYAHLEIHMETLGMCRRRYAIVCLLSIYTEIHINIGNLDNWALCLLYCPFESSPLFISAAHIHFVLLWHSQGWWAGWVVPSMKVKFYRETVVGSSPAPSPNGEHSAMMQMRVWFMIDWHRRKIHINQVPGEAWCRNANGMLIECWMALNNGRGFSAINARHNNWDNKPVLNMSVANRVTKP